MEEIIKTCLHRLVGDCEGCKRDYSGEYPENTDCPKYYEISMTNFKTGDTDGDKRIYR